MSNQNINIPQEETGTKLVPIEIDGDVYDIHPKVLELIESISDQVKEVLEYKFPESFDVIQKN